MMDVTFHPGPAPLIAAAGAYLGQERFSGSVLAVVARRVADGEAIGEPGALWATVHEGGEVVGAAMQTPPWNVFLVRMPPPAAVALADAVADAGRALPGVNGEAATVRAFAARWWERTGRDSEVRLRQRMYVLARWAEAFHEAQPEAPVQDWHDWARLRIDAGQLHLWRVGGEPVAMAAVTVPAAGVARIGPVYTAPTHRRRGHGSGVTAAATAAAVAGGAEDVVLYTDLAKPTSKAIYQAIGYRPHHDAEERAFV